MASAAWNSSPLPFAASQTSSWRRRSSNSSSTLACTACFPTPDRKLSIAPSSARFISVLSIAPRRTVRPLGVFALDPDFYKIPYVEGVPVGKRLKIWNLPPNTDPQEFRAWFDGLEGVSVESVEFTDDPELNAQNIWGFIEFGTKQEACMAIVRRDGYKFKGRCIRMDFVEKKPHEREIGGRRNRPTYRNNSMSSSSRMGSSGNYGYGAGASSPFFASRNSGSSAPATGIPSPGGLAGSTSATTAAGSAPLSSFDNGNSSTPGYMPATGYNNNPPSSVYSAYGYPSTPSGGTTNTGYGNVPPASGATGYGSVSPVSGGAAATINGSTPTPIGGTESTGSGTPGYGSTPSASNGPAATINGSIPSTSPSTGGGYGTAATGYGSPPSVTSSAPNMSSVTGSSSQGSTPTTASGTPATGYGSLIPNTRNYSSSPTTSASNSEPTLSPNTRSNVSSSNNTMGSSNYVPASSFGATSGTSPYQGTAGYSNIPNQSTPSRQSVPNYGNPAFGSSQSAPSYGSPQAPAGYASYGRDNQLSDTKQFGSNISFDSSESSDAEYETSQAPSYSAQSTSAPNYGSNTMQSSSTYGNATQFPNSYGQNDFSFSGGNNYGSYNVAGTAYARSGYSTPRPSSSNRMFVGNLPWSTDDMSLQQLFSEYGNVLDARVVKDRETGRSRGFGFVSMSTAEEMNSAIQGLDGRQVEGRSIRVNQAESRY